MSMPAQSPISSVVHVIYSGLGGHAAVMFSLLEGGFLRGARHHVVLAGVEPPLPDYVERLGRLGISWAYVDKPPGRGHLGFFRRLRAQFREHAPDLIFLNGLAAAPAVIAPPRARDGRKPLVLLRESEPVQLKGLYEWMLLGLAHQVVDQIVHLTPEAAEGGQAMLGALHHPDKVTIIPNGLDVDFFKPQPRARTAGSLQLGMVSRLQHKKDHITLLAAFDRLRAARPDLDMTLHIAGDGDTRGPIEAEIARRGLGEAVVMHGILDAAGVRALLAGLDIYVHATFGETMSNSIMQAMAMGLPIVASDVNGVGNMIGSQYGVLYPSRDDAALAARLLRWIEHPDEAARFGERARARAEAEYDAAKVVARYEALALEKFARR